MCTECKLSLNIHIHAKHGPLFGKNKPKTGFFFFFFTLIFQRVDSKPSAAFDHKNKPDQCFSKAVSTNSRISNREARRGVNHCSVCTELEQAHRDTYERRPIRRRLGLAVTSLYQTGTRHPRPAQAVTNGPNFHLFTYLLCGPRDTCWRAPP